MTGVTVKCTSCRLEVTGSLIDGLVRPSDRIRPEPDAGPIQGLCVRCAESPVREAPCSRCGSDWHYTDEHVSEETA